MTRKEILEKQYQQSLVSNGYVVPPRSLEQIPNGGMQRVKIIKKTVTLGVILTLLWWVYRIGTIVCETFHKYHSTSVEEHSR